MMRNLFWITVTSLMIFNGILVIGCRKECRTVNLKKIKCPKGCERIEGVIVYDRTWRRSESGQVNLIVDNESVYDSIFDGSKEFGDIDFSNRVLLGVEITTNPAERVYHQSYICENDDKKKWTYTTEYSLSWQCKGAHISQHPTGFWVNAPKIPSGYTVEFIVVDINPFPD